MSATPRPWRVDNLQAEFMPGCEYSGERDWIKFIDSGNITVGRVHGNSAEEANANAALIVRAVNCHDELVAALESCVNQMKMRTHICDNNGITAINKASAIIAKAREVK